MCVCVRWGQIYKQRERERERKLTTEEAEGRMERGACRAKARLGCSLSEGCAQGAVPREVVKT